MYASSVQWMDDVRRDVSYALRGLARNPAFAVAAVVTLALGIGNSSSQFSSAISRDSRAWVPSTFQILWYARTSQLCSPNNGG
jgi:hypothetical protein